MTIAIKGYASRIITEKRLNSRRPNVYTTRVYIVRSNKEAKEVFKIGRTLSVSGNGGARWYW